MKEEKGRLHDRATVGGRRGKGNVAGEGGKARARGRRRCGFGSAELEFTVGVSARSTMCSFDPAHAWDGTGRHGTGRNGTGWDGMGWDGMGWEGMGREGMRCDGKGRDQT